jgi:hypothetical protein
MKKLSALFVFLAGCTTTHYAGIRCHKTWFDRGTEFDQCTESQRQQREADELEVAREKTEQQRIQFEAEKVWKIGASKEDFDKLWEAPPAQEFYEGKTVYWYRDDDEPVFVVFTNDKISAIVIDRDTLRDRADARRHAQTQQQLRQMAAQQQSAARWSAINSSIQQSQLNKIEQNTQPVYHFQPINQKTH